jgi:hypothetical protein
MCGDLDELKEFWGAITKTVWQGEPAVLMPVEADFREPLLIGLTLGKQVYLGRTGELKAEIIEPLIDATIAYFVNGGSIEFAPNFMDGLGNLLLTIQGAFTGQILSGLAARVVVSTEIAAACGGELLAEIVTELHVTSPIPSSGMATFDAFRYLIEAIPVGIPGAIYIEVFGISLEVLRNAEAQSRSHVEAVFAILVHHYHRDSERSQA